MGFYGEIYIIDTRKLPISFGYVCADFWYYWGWTSKWGGMRDFPFFFSLSWIPKIVIKSFFFKTPDLSYPIIIFEYPSWTLEGGTRKNNWDGYSWMLKQSMFASFSVRFVPLNMDDLFLQTFPKPVLPCVEDPLLQETYSLSLPRWSSIFMHPDCLHDQKRIYCNWMVRCLRFEALFWGL